jgi:acyl-CoA synthetase (AMP-forming)/AMP-acid ligase II
MAADERDSRRDDHLSRVFRSSFPDAEWTGFRTRSWSLGTPRSAEELKPLHPTLLHAFAMAAKLDAETGITLIPESETAPEEHHSYRKIYHAATRAAGALATLGVRKGDRVLIILPTSFDFVISFFAVELLGAVPVPSYPPALLERAELALDRLRHIGTHADAWYCITSHKLRPLLGELAFTIKNMRHLVPFEELLEGDPNRAPKARAHGADPGFIQYTSGSTGHPKGVLLAHENLVANIHAIGQACRINRDDRVVSWLPLYHDMGLIGALLFSIYWRLPLALMAPTTFLLRPSRWLTTIHKHRGTLSPAPNFAYALAVKRVRAHERVGLDLSSWRLALNGAEPVNLRTLVDFQRTYEPFGFKPEALLPVYGLAESCLAVTFPRPGQPLRYEVVDRSQLAAGHAVEASGQGSTAIVSVGQAVPGHEVLVLDETGAPLGDREVGHVVVRGPSVMRGYYNDPDATSAVVRGGWLWTGDLGYFSGGQLYVTGRAKDLIILRGRNHYAEDLERVAERVDGVRAGGSAAFGVYDEDKATDLVVVVCETKIPAADEQRRTKLVEAIVERVSNDTGVHVDEVVLVPSGTIPKTSSGKRQRALCRELYLKDELTRTRTGRIRLMMVFARSGAGLLMSKARRLFQPHRRAPD